MTDAPEAPFRPQDQPLRDDVRWLGAIVGDLLKEHGSPGLFERVETARRAARARRRGETEEARAALHAATTGLEPERAQELVRAFSAYFFAVNFAERAHRVRRSIEYRREDRPQPGSLLDVVTRWRASGAPRTALERRVREITAEPVFTAHPTEATRRSVLVKEQRLARALVDRIEGLGVGAEEGASLEARVRNELTALWQTEEHPEERPTVEDEAEHVAFYLTEVIWRVVPHLHEHLERLLDVAQPLPPLVRFGTWVGGDMDGNPNVGPHTVRATLDRQRAACLRKIRAEVATLADWLTQSQGRAAFAAEFLERSERARRRRPEVFQSLPARHERMPYRAFLTWIAHRLDATAANTADAYGDPDELLADLRSIHASLWNHGGRDAGAFLVRRLVRRVEVFGFHLATLDVRQHALVHRRALARVLGDPEFPQRDAAERTRRLEAAWKGAAALSPELQTDEETQRTLDVFRAIADAIAHHGPRAIGCLIVSMAKGPDDALAPLVLARAAGRTRPDGEIALDVTPLFETVADLEGAHTTMDALFAHPLYRAHLNARGGRQVVMLGYSDSNKDSGIAASRHALYAAQERLVATARRHGVELVLFHGRGGSLSRGGGKPRQAILAEPPGALERHLRVTEQGEILHAKYGLRGLASRTLELMVGAMLERAQHDPAPIDDAWRAAARTFAETSRARYRAVVHEDPRFLAYFRDATPIDVIERMPLGSRPARRTGQAGIDDLRAIPWVFAWTQSRHLLPGWFGVGEGLRAACERHGVDTLRAMTRSWPFLDRLLADVEMSLAKSDLDIAERYAELAGESGAVLFATVRAEHARTHEHLLLVREQRVLLEREPVLQRALTLRNPYVDPMSLVQVDLLQRWRAADRSDGALERALIETVHGIARGMQNTG